MVTEYIAKFKVQDDEKVGVRIVPDDIDDDEVVTETDLQNEIEAEAREIMHGAPAFDYLDEGQVKEASLIDIETIRH